MNWIIDSFQSSDGRNPYDEWFMSLPSRGKSKVRSKLNIIKAGAGLSFKSIKPLGNGLYELKFRAKGLPAYRIYLCQGGINTLVLLSAGSHKDDQARDIQKAKSYFSEFLEGRRNG